MSSYRLITYRGEAGPEAGVVLDADYYSAASVLDSPAYGSILKILDDWEACAPKLSAFARDKQRAGRPIASAELIAPIPRPGTIYCAGANYADHMANMARKLGIPPERDPHELGLSP